MQSYYLNLEELDNEQLQYINGGQYPSENTGFWYDLAFFFNAGYYLPRPGWLL